MELHTNLEKKLPLWFLRKVDQQFTVVYPNRPRHGRMLVSTPKEKHTKRCYMESIHCAGLRCIPKEASNLLCLWERSGSVFASAQNIWKYQDVGREMSDHTQHHIPVSSGRQMGQLYPFSSCLTGRRSSSAFPNHLPHTFMCILMSKFMCVSTNTECKIENMHESVYFRRHEN